MDSLYLWWGRGWGVWRGEDNAKLQSSCILYNNTVYQAYFSPFVSFSIEVMKNMLLGNTAALRVEYLVGEQLYWRVNYEDVKKPGS